MPTRMLREGIVTSKAVNALTDTGEIFYRRLMSIVDDFGRIEVDIELLRLALFGRALDRWPLTRVREALADVSTVRADDGGPPTGDREPLVTIYTVSGKTYLQLNNFGQRLRSKHSKCPSPDGAPPHLADNVGRGGGEVGSGDEVGDGGEQAVLRVNSPAPEPPDAPLARLPAGLPAQIPNSEFEQAQADAVRRVIDAFGDPRYGGTFVGCTDVLLRSVLAKAEFYGLSGFEVGSLFQRKLRDCQRSPSTWPQGAGWFVSLVEQEGKARAKPMGREVAELAARKRL